jgi:acyl carrier protein
MQVALGMTGTDSIEQVLLEWLRESGQNNTVAVESASKLLELEVLDSLGILQFVGFIEQTFKIAMPLEDFVPDNFETPKKVAEMVARIVEARS